jgi:NTE family protein
LQHERNALVLQGGGALGAYQGGVYQALAEAHLHPDWVAGISIGSINSAIIAGNAPEHRVERLREFWETVSEAPLGAETLGLLPAHGEMARKMLNQAQSVVTLLFGAPGFFSPRTPPWLCAPGTPGAVSYYETGPLRSTLERLVDFDRINERQMRFSVGAVNVRSGNFVYFDTETTIIRPEHVMASGALPPGFPPVEIDGEYYWDGGLVSNTPLLWVLDTLPRADSLVFQVDLWSARGELPRDLVEVDLRQKEIRYSSRTRAATDEFRKMQTMRNAVARLLKALPAERRASGEAMALVHEACPKVFNIIQLIYRARAYEGDTRDYEFSRQTMHEHWQAGYNDAVRTLRYPEVLQRHEDSEGVFTFDVLVQGRD